MPEFHFRDPELWFWPAPKPGEVVPDYPPQDLTPYVKAVDFGRVLDPIDDEDVEIPGGLIDDPGPLRRAERRPKGGRADG